MWKKLKENFAGEANIQIFVWLGVSVFLGGLFCSAVNASEKSLKEIDLTKIDSGFFVSKKDVDGLQDGVFREELTRFLTEEGILTKSSKGLIYYYISENQIDQIENPEFKQRVKEFVAEPEERIELPQKAVHSVHEVQPGDSLWNISKRYGMSVDELVRINKLAPTDPIYPGQKLLVTPDWSY